MALQEEGPVVPPRKVVEDCPALLIFYHSSQAVHDALDLRGSPVQRGINPEGSLANFDQQIHRIIARALNRHLKLVEDVSSTRVQGTTAYFHNIYHRLSRRTYVELVSKLKDGFAAADPWVQALTRPLGVLIEVWGVTGYGAVEVVPEAISFGPFKYPHP